MKQLASILLLALLPAQTAQADTGDINMFFLWPVIAVMSATYCVEYPFKRLFPATHPPHGKWVASLQGGEEGALHFAPGNLSFTRTHGHIQNLWLTGTWEKTPHGLKIIWRTGEQSDAQIKFNHILVTIAGTNLKFHYTP